MEASDAIPVRGSRRVVRLGILALVLTIGAVWVYWQSTFYRPYEIHIKGVERTDTHTIVHFMAGPDSLYWCSGLSISMGDEPSVAFRKGTARGGMLTSFTLPANCSTFTVVGAYGAYGASVKYHLDELPRTDSSRD